METLVQPWVKAIVENAHGEMKMAPGAVLQHPDGRTVKIMNGQYWGTRGWSNSWVWREVRGNGRLGPEESGYGWA